MRSQRRGLTAGVTERIGTAVYVVLMAAAQEALVLSLEALNQAVLAKPDGLGEYDLRRPLTPTGSNMLDRQTPRQRAGRLFRRHIRSTMARADAVARRGRRINDDMFATAAESIALGEAETIDRR